MQSFALDLRLEKECPLTVTGGMPFAGSRFNHFSLEGVARMVEVLGTDTPEAAPGRCPHLRGHFQTRDLELGGKRSSSVLRGA